MLLKHPHLLESMFPNQQVFCSGFWVSKKRINLNATSLDMFGKLFWSSRMVHGGSCQHLGTWLPRPLWLWSKSAADVPSWDDVTLASRSSSHPERLWGLWLQVGCLRKYFTVPNSAKFVRSGTDAVPLDFWHLSELYVWQRQSALVSQVQMLTDTEHPPAGSLDRSMLTELQSFGTFVWSWHMVSLRFLSFSHILIHVSLIQSNWSAHHPNSSKRIDRWLYPLT